eukprot:scaffold825_cov249-Pinguiococcus_pyrenoidosus.AAC.6
MAEFAEMAHLVSMPLCRKRADGTLEALQELSYEEEREDLFRCLQRGRVALRVTWDYASNEKFQLAFNSRILHFTGHGEDEGLVLEVRRTATFPPFFVATLVQTIGSSMVLLTGRRPGQADGAADHHGAPSATRLQARGGGLQCVSLGSGGQSVLRGRREVRRARAQHLRGRGHRRARLRADFLPGARARGSGAGGLRESARPRAR